MLQAQHAARLTLDGLAKATTPDEIRNLASPAQITIDNIADYQYEVTLPDTMDSSLSAADEAPWRYAAQPKRALCSVARHAHRDM